MMIEKYEPQNIEKKWQGRWESAGTFAAGKPAAAGAGKFYCLVMFPYPSGRIHMGHVRNYVIGDVIARYRRMRDYDVMHPIGWDAFGLPAENAAIKHGIHPAKWTRDNIDHMRAQLKELGISYDWKREFATCDPSFYRWNQWFFMKMYEKGLAYRKKSPVNWCYGCKTVLANEQVGADGECWRCGSVVEEKEFEQWFLRITAYADELLEGHSAIEDGWPQEVIAMQRNWIGRSYGAEVDFRTDLPGTGGAIRIYTTRPDTLFGATFLTLSPEHPASPAIASSNAEVASYVKASKAKSKKERTTLEKTGVFTGYYAVNPVNGKKIPVWMADYVLLEYGTGAIMCVPAHDSRDFGFAKKFGIEIIEVIRAPEGTPSLPEKVFEGDGTMVNSGSFNGLLSPDGKEKVTRWLEEKGLGKSQVNYRLRDWLISRQRYWGTPIPVIYCSKCGTRTVPEKDLPVLLPENVKITGIGESPLKSAPEFLETKCPYCGLKASRETDTMDTFFDSSWYFARYCDPANASAPFAREAADRWLPVDQYVGGIEHACMHLIYARFFHKVMRDLGLVGSDEPFGRLLTQGMVTLGGAAMSKSRGNTIEPSETIKAYGADTTRMFQLFAAPPEKQLEWSDKGVVGSWKFLNRVWHLAEGYSRQSKGVSASVTAAAAGEAGFSQSPKESAAADNAGQSCDSRAGSAPADAQAAKRLLRRLNRTVKKVTEDMESGYKFNTAISSIMELVNEMQSYPAGDPVYKESLEKLILLLAPFAPHICEELWESIGGKGGLASASWPAYDESLIEEEFCEIVIQVNGRVRSRMSLPKGADESSVRKSALTDEKLSVFLKGGVRKFVFVKDKLLNIVTG